VKKQRHCWFREFCDRLLSKNAGLPGKVLRSRSSRGRRQGSATSGRRGGPDPLARVHWETRSPRVRGCRCHPRATGSSWARRSAVSERPLHQHRQDAQPPRRRRRRRHRRATPRPLVEEKSPATQAPPRLASSTWWNALLSAEGQGLHAVPDMGGENRVARDGRGASVRRAPGGRIRGVVVIADMDPR
jgi:hypothetical protein